MVRASVRAIIHLLTLVDYLPVQTHKPYSNNRLILVPSAPEYALLSHNQSGRCSVNRSYVVIYGGKNSPLPKVPLLILR